jgi:hypothetical protein
MNLNMNLQLDRMLRLSIIVVWAHEFGPTPMVQDVSPDGVTNAMGRDKAQLNQNAATHCLWTPMNVKRDLTLWLVSPMSTTIHIRVHP